LAFGRADYYNLSNFFRGLTFLAEGSEPQLDLAQSVDISPDGLTYRFTLREGILFHHGRPAVAEDFRWTIERAAAPAQAAWVQGFLVSVAGFAEFVGGTADTLAGVTAPDDRTLVITLSVPDARLLSILGIPPFYVLPREEVERLGDAFRQTPVGTGPYRLAGFDGPGSTMTATRFEDYIYRDHLPYLDEIEIRWNVTEDLQYLQVSRGDADLSMSVPTAVVAEIEATPELAARFSRPDSLDVQWWALNVGKAPFDDVRVRRAVNHAVNLSRTAAFGINPTGHLYPPGLLGFSDAAPIYAHDPDRARALLAEAGVTDLEMRIAIMASATADNARIAQLFAQDLEAVGIRVVLEQRQESSYDIAADLRDNYHMWNMFWGMGLPDPSELASNHFGTGGSANLAGYSNPALDAAAQAALGITDRAARGQAYADIEAALLADAPFLFLGIRPLNSLRSARLQNFVYDPAIWTYWDRYWLADA
jgi:ABC-type transport system substrate-binding protein